MCFWSTFKLTVGWKILSYLPFLSSWKPFYYWVCSGCYCKGFIFEKGLLWQILKLLLLTRDIRILSSHCFTMLPTLPKYHTPRTCTSEMHNLLEFPDPFHDWKWVRYHEAFLGACCSLLCRSHEILNFANKNNTRLCSCFNLLTILSWISGWNKQI